MNKDVTLYLGGEAIEWSKVPDILLTYQRTDYLNPTVTKNMFSKTITIDGTPRNNNIFNHIWQLDRIMDEGFTLFNPSQRVSFELFNNAETVEKGYAKLNSIKKTGYKIAYNITLYGGLGSFFYNLAYDIDTDKEKTLADLNFMGGSNPDDEFDFEIRKETVYDAWSRIGKPNNTGSWKKWDYINFVPCYNGIPEDFDANRVLINVHSLNNTQVRYTNGNRVITDNFPMYISDDENSYSSVNGYLTAEMMRDCDEWKMRDLRSYLQRPCLSVKGFFNAIKNPINNGGYDVVLDSEFFSSGNPHYSKAFITLPMLKPETDAVDQLINWSWYKDDQYQYTGDGPKEVKWKLASVSPIVGTPDVFSMDVEVHITVTGTSAERLYTSTLNNNGYDGGYEPDPDFGDPDNPPQLFYYGCTTIQLYGFGNSNVWVGASGKCGSPLIVLTSKLQGQYIGTQSINTWYGDRPYPDGGIQYNFGYWKKVSGSDYVWHNETDNTDTINITMESNLMSEIPNLALAFSNITIMNGMLTTGYHSKCGCAYDSQYYDYYGDMNNGTFNYWRTVDVQSLDSKIIYKVNGQMRSFQPMTKKDLLGGLEGTPCDWLLSYCKLFGLFIEKDKINDTIYIKLRNNWYKDETIDLDDLIDRSKEINVTPLTFESKWYNFKYGEAEGKFLDRYKNDYSQEFGKQLIDTKYNFDADEIDLLEDTKFRNGLTALEKSNYFNTKKDVNGNQIPQCLFDWCTVTYYNDADTLETNMCLPQQVSTETINPQVPKEFYDAVPKLQIRNDEGSPTDGDGVLVFFNGLKNTNNADYWISDDVEEMFIDSDRPCWLQTRNEWNTKWTERIAIQTTTIPEFNRYVTHNNIITADWDFGYTKELFVPYYTYDVNRTPTMYENFWRSYIKDLYSVNTRNVECNVALNSNDVYDFMKKFYWWDNCLWVCTKVSDFDIALDKSTKCSFTKVNNKNAYLEMPTFNDFFFNFTRSDGGYNVPAQGTDEERSFYFNLDCSTTWMVIDDGSGFASFDPNYPTEGGFGMGYTIKAKYEPNYSQAPRYALYSAYDSEGNARMIRVWQDGYVKEKELTLTPNSITLPKTVSSATTVQVQSSANWFCNAGSWVVISPTYGNSGTTNISVSATTNSGEQRTLQVLFNNADGLSTTLNVQQKGMANVTLEQNSNGWPITTVPASGRSVSYRLVNDIECTVEPLGNTENYAVASGLVTYHTTVQPSSGTNFYISVSPNTSTVTRNIAFYAYYVEDGGRYTVMPTIIPLPLVQEASGNTTVELLSKQITSATTLGASMPWTATTNNSWITILTPSGSSSDHSVQYTVAQNNGSFRKGYIYVTYKDEMGYFCNETIVIMQEGVDVPVVINPTGISVSDRGGDYVITVESPTDYTVSSSESWVSKNIQNSNMFTIHIDENQGFDRTMNINITTNGNTYTVVINQGSKYSDNYTLDYAPQSIVFDAEGGTIDVTIRSNSPWTISEGNNIE